MLRKRVSLDGQSNRLIDLRTKTNEKENKNPSFYISEKQFKTPEKKHQITIENTNTTVTITNYFHQCKSSYQRENIQNKSFRNFRGLEKKLSFSSLKENNFTLQTKDRYKSNSHGKKSKISITFSELKKNGFNFVSKRFHSNNKLSTYKSETYSNSSKGSFFSSQAHISSDSLYLDELNHSVSNNKSSAQESDDSLDSNLCCHKTIPFNKINDENYKIIALKKIRKQEIPHIKSVNCKFFEYKRRPFDYDGNVTKFYELYNLKRRKVSSLKKIYQGYGEFIDQETGKKMTFCFYEDKEVGFSSEWQKKLRVSDMDDDVKTDDEQLLLAKKHIFKELKEGFSQFNRMKNNRKN